MDTNVVTFITPDGTRELPLMSKADVADAILDEIFKAPRPLRHKKYALRLQGVFFMSVYWLPATIILLAL